MSSQNAEQQLIALAVAGDHFALGRLFVNHYDRIARRVSRLLPAGLRGSLSVDDVVQETFVQAIANIAQLRQQTPAAFTAWLTAIAEHQTHNAIAALRRRKRGAGRTAVSLSADGRTSSYVALVNLLSDRSETPSRTVAQREAVQAIQIGIACLPDDQRAAVCLRYLDCKTVDETAAELDRSPGAVRGLLQRARRALRVTLGRSSRWFYKK